MIYEVIINTLIDEILNKTKKPFQTDIEAIDYGMKEFSNNINILSVRIFACTDNKLKQIMELNRTPFATNY